MVEIDWVAVQGVGTAAAAIIGVLAYRSAKKSAADDRTYDAAQDAVDAEQGASIVLLADAVRKMAEQQETTVRALADRVAELEKSRDPKDAERRRAVRAKEDAEAHAALADLESRLEKITLYRRDGLAGGGWSAATMDRKRVIRMTKKPRAEAKTCPECKTKVVNGVKRCPECDHAFA